MREKNNIMVLVKYRNEPIVETGSLIKKYAKEVVKSLKNESSYKLVYGEELCH